MIAGLVCALLQHLVDTLQQLQRDTRPTGDAYMLEGQLRPQTRVHKPGRTVQARHDGLCQVRVCLFIHGRCLEQVI